jgi:acetylornithine/succinyldiaminopimelate/putrescine aminotransferase
MIGVDIEGDAPGVVQRALLEHHLVINATGPNTLRFVPPLVITDQQIDSALDSLSVLLS